MNKNAILAMALVGLLALAMYAPAASAITPPNTLVIGTIGMPETVDPAWAYDTASAELIFNVYEPLIYYKVDRTKDPKEQGSIDEFVPGLATEWTIEEIDETSPHGVHWSYRYTFKIRTGVTFHNGNPLTPEDVEYSIERILVQDRTGGPEWMWYYPLLGRNHAPGWTRTKAPTLREWIYKIDEAVESNDTHVWFNFMTLLGPPMSQLQIMTQSWGSIVDKEWCTSYAADWDGQYTEPFHFRGDADLDGVVGGKDAGFLGLHWPPQPYDVNADFDRDGVIGGKDAGIIGLNWGATGDAKGWWKYHDPPVSPMDDTSSGGPRMMGTGPYKFDYLDTVGKKWHVVRNPDYWGGWPSALNSPSAGYQGYLDDVLYKVIDEWGTRKEQFLACDLDFCYVPREYIGDVQGQPHIECIYPLQVLAVDAIFYNFAVPENSPYAGGPTGNGYPSGTFAENGIPRDFFSDVHVRRAFSYSFDYATYIADVFLGEAVHPSTPMVEGLGPKTPIDVPKLIAEGGTLTNGTYLPPVPVWPFNLTAAAEEFKLAFGGTLESPGPVWTNGFTFTITYNTGNVPRLRVAQMFKAYIEAMNSKFHINIQEVDWDTYLDDMVNYPYYQAKMPIFIIGWLADFPDVHNFIFPFFHSEGDFSYFQSYYNEEVDALIMEGIGPRAISDPDYRAAIYWELGNLYREEMPSLPTVQGLGRHWQKDWVKGWYYNPIYPGDYFYHLWKEMPH
jgi:peptide/nickel transport system substrate-binding protein